LQLPNPAPALEAIWPAVTIYFSRNRERLASLAVRSTALLHFIPGLKFERAPSTQNGVPVVTKGGSIVDHRARFSTLNASYEEFLFAQVCEETNGMRLSVLSALARMNVDPWEEAIRLAAMPKTIAEKTLLSILDLVSGKSWKSPEAAAIVARLVRLLPQADEAAPLEATGNAQALAQRKSYWWVWVGFALTMSLMTQHHQTTTATTNAATTQSGAITTSGATTPLKDRATAPDPVGQSR
jgi:hypothetical protein